jgi:GNAT superfamily N-acetyltransferase
MYHIQIATTDEEIASTFPVMQQLRTHLLEDQYVPLIREMQRNAAYQLALLREGGTVGAVAGFRITQSLAWHHFVYIDDLVSNEQARSKGYGTALMQWVGDYGKARGCIQLHLDSGVQRHGAHRFYLRERMDITCYHFKLDLQ